MKGLAALAVGCLLLTSCSSPQLSAKQQLQNDTADLVTAANAKDPVSLSTAITALTRDIDNLQSTGVFSKARGESLKRLLVRIQLNSGDLNASPTASPTDSPTASPTPSVSPTSSPTPSPTPSSSPTSSPTPAASQTATAPPTVVPSTLGVGIGESPAATSHP